MLGGRVRCRAEDGSDEGGTTMGEPTYEEIARRAHEISERSDAGSAEDNWHRAERELREPANGEGPWAKLGSGDTESMTTDEPKKAGTRRRKTES
jgi:hypothetical protein